MREDHKINWPAIGGVGALFAAAMAAATFLFTIAPDKWKVTATIIFFIILLFPVLGYFLFPMIKIKITKHGRLIKSLAVASLIPMSHYLLLEASWRSVLFTIINMAGILLIIYISKEWRTIKPLRSDTVKDGPFQWGGILNDEVGRGPGENMPDGAPDALFRLKLPKSGEKVISNIILRRLKPNRESTSQIWRSEMDDYNWVLGVVVDGQRIEPDRYGELNIKLSETQKIELFASDSWSPSNWFDSGQIYEVEVKYKDEQKPDTFELVIP